MPISNVNAFWWVLAVQGLLRADAWVDVVILGGREYDNVLVYRARVLSSNIERMIIAQEHRSFSGAAGQPQLSASVLTTLRTYIPGGVTLLRWKASQAGMHWHREWALRSRLIHYLNLHVKNTTVYISDVDEIPDAMRVPHRMTALDNCKRLRMKFTYYSPMCNFGVWGHGGVMVHTASPDFAAWTRVTRHSEALNGLVRGASCASPPGLFGWHLSYAMNTVSIRRKLRAFSHANDGFVLKALKKNDSYFDQAASTCTDLFLRKTVVASCSANYLPPAGWPSHPAAPRAC
jgi:hypothetical protein